LGSEIKTAPTSPHVVWEGFKKNPLHSSKTKLQHIQSSNTTRTSKESGFYGQIRLKNIFLAANPPDGFGGNRDKKYPLPTVKYTTESLMLWPYFFDGGPRHLVQIHGIMDSSN